ncbi:translation initiation factor IF-2 N-terminal domain-containing protein [Enterococcus faecium]
MGNKRIYELAKELKKSSKDVVEKAQQLGTDMLCDSAGFAACYT